MARYKFVDMSPRLLPVDLEAKLASGTYAHVVHHLVDVLDRSAFDAHYRNDVNGAPAHAQGIVSTRAIERACRDNVLFIAITGGAHGQAQSRHRRRPQTRKADLRDADEGRGIHRPWSGLLRRTISRARLTIRPA